MNAQQPIDQMLDSLSMPTNDKYKSLTNRIALYYYTHSDYQKALEYWQKGLEQAYIENDSLWIANSTYNVGFVYSALNDFEKTIVWNKKALVYYEALHHKKGQAAVSNVFGLIYYDQKNYSKALEYFETCKVLSYEMNDIIGVCGALNNTGLIYLSEEKLPEALNSFKEAEKLLAENDMLNSQASTISNIGLVYYRQKENEKALEYFQKSYAIKKQLGNKKGIASTLNNMAGIYIRIGNYSQAEKLLLEAKEIAILIEDGEILFNNYDHFYELYSKKKNYLAAIESLLKSQETKEKEYKKNTDKQLMEMQVKYDFESKEKEILLLTKSKNIQELQISKQSLWINGLLVLLAVFIISMAVIISIYIEKLRANRELVQKNLEIVASEKELQETKVELNEKYQGSNLTKDDKQKIAHEISLIFIKEKPYLGADFNADQLAKLLNINKSYLSEVINDVLHKNFNGLINEYRIKEARRLFSEPDIERFTIEYISEKVGFSSISTFNRAFKKYLGVTPSFYLKTIVDKGL